MPCGSGMTVAQLRIAVKAKQPNVAVSKLNKPALLAFYEGRKKNAPKIPKMTKAVKAKGATLSKAKKAPPIPAPLKAPALPAPSASMKASDAKKNRKPDALPAHLTMMIRKMATDSSAQDNEKPHIALQRLMDKELKWAIRVHEQIHSSEIPQSFAHRLILLTDADNSLRGKYGAPKPEMLRSVVTDYIKLHRFGCAIRKRIRTIHDEYEREITALEWKHKAKLDDYYLLASHSNPINKKLFVTVQKINHFFNPLHAYLALNHEAGTAKARKEKSKFPRLEEESFKRGYNHHHCEFEEELIDKYKVPGKTQLLASNNYNDKHHQFKAIGKV